VHALYAYPDLLAKIANNEFNDKFQVEVPFHQVQKFVPNNVYLKVNQDNQLHIAESQICCNPFFKTTVVLLSGLAKSIDQNP
jgi:hypothetical protein